MKPFTDTLREIEGGTFVDELTKATYEMVKAVREVRKPGVITIKIGFEPTGRGTVTLHSKVESKTPQHDRMPTTFFLTAEDTLLRDDPAQEKLPLRAVGDDDGPIRAIRD
jgi:hypothetical protein